jgi:protein SCO1/2
VQPLFVTVDPERDTPDVLNTFTASFHPRLVGLTGSRPQVDAALKRFRVYSSKVPGATPGSYLMDHMAAIYLYDPEGRPVAFVPGPEATAAKVRDMLGTHVV